MHNSARLLSTPAEQSEVPLQALQIPACHGPFGAKLVVPAPIRKQTSSERPTQCIRQAGRVEAMLRQMCSANPATTTLGSCSQGLRVEPDPRRLDKPASGQKRTS